MIDKFLLVFSISFLFLMFIFIVIPSGTDPVFQKEKSPLDCNKIEIGYCFDCKIGEWQTATICKEYLGG